jgi:RsiW-degrading membrane proteinase PrsW (M82 family)
MIVETRPGVLRPAARPDHWEKALVTTAHTAPPSTFARRHSWLTVLVAGTALFLVEERTLVATQNPNLVPSVILLGATIVPLTFLAFVYGRRLPYTVPGPAVAASAFLGGVIGTIVAATLEFDVLRDLGGLPMFFVGLIEETSKLLIPLVLLVLLRRHRSRADGLLIGVACGAGFAALETMGYAFTTLIKSQGSITDTVDILLLRGFLSPAGHMAWTGIAAAALYAAAETRTGGAVLRFVGAFIGAVVLHTLWDSAGTLVVTAVVAAVSLAALGYTAHRAGHHGARAGVAFGRRM